MKRFLLFTWQNDVCNGGRECVQAGWNSFRNSYESYDLALLAFQRDYTKEDFGQIVDLESADIWELNN